MSKWISGWMLCDDQCWALLHSNPVRLDPLIAIKCTTRSTVTCALSWQTFSDVASHVWHLFQSHVHVALMCVYQTWAVLVLSLCWARRKFYCRTKFPGSVDFTAFHPYQRYLGNDISRLSPHQPWSYYISLQLTMLNTDLKQVTSRIAQCNLQLSRLSLSLFIVT